LSVSSASFWVDYSQTELTDLSLEIPTDLLPDTTATRSPALKLTYARGSHLT
jgi:hypothetical protein